MIRPDIPAGLPGFRRATCLGCAGRVVAARDSHVVITGRRDGSWLALIDAEPDGILVTDSERIPENHVFLLGVAHRRCIRVAKKKLERGEVELSDDLPQMLIDEPDDPPEALHLPPNSDSCPFCGNPQLTWEHVLPKWFSEMFDGGFIERASARPRRRVELKVPVCPECNNRWLAVLENDAKRVLSPMVRGEPLVSLNTDDQLLIGTWAVKTALMLDLASGSGPIIPLGFFRQARQLRSPLPNTVVHVGAYKDQMAVKAWHDGLYVPDASGVKPDKPNGFVTTFAVHRVVFQVLGHFTVGGATFKDSRLLGAGLHAIWPSRAETIQWPRNNFAFGDEALQELASSVSYIGPD